MKYCFVTIIFASALTLSIVMQQARAQNTTTEPVEKMSAMIGDTRVVNNSSHEWNSIFVTNVPLGYRDWKLISIAHEEGNLTDIRAILGNDIAIKAFREGTLPLPDGSIIARIAWSHDASEENDNAFVPFLKPGGVQQSFVAGHPTNGVQFMVKDSKKYVQTGGWGYAHFNDGKPANAIFMQSCYPCHQAIKSRDFVFTRYAP